MQKDMKKIAFSVHLVKISSAPPTVLAKEIFLSGSPNHFAND